jgi:hypothetical protein
VLSHYCHSDSKFAGYNHQIQGTGDREQGIAERAKA